MKKIIILIFTVVLFTNCKKDFLSRSSLTELAEDNFWKNSADAQVGINGIYDVLQDRLIYGGGLNEFNGIGLPLYDTFTDNAFNSYRFEGPASYIEGNLDPSGRIFSNFWAANYRGIARSNSAIENISKMTSTQINDANKAFLIAQARFLRALFYFNVAVYFEDAPLITETQLLENAYVPKNNQQEILTQVVEDLTAASEVLPVTVSADLTGYATKGAALGLLARVHLFSKNYAAAAAAAKGVMDLGFYNLTTPYGTIFTEAGENTREIVFSVRFQEAAGFATGSTFGATFTGQPKVNSQPLANLVNEYYNTAGQPVSFPTTTPSATQKANRDPRLALTIWFRGDVFATNNAGANVTFGVNSPSNFTTYGQRKYAHTRTSPLGTNTAGAQSQDFYILRYADILLMRAEALIESDPTNPEIYTLINQVRARVTMPSIEAAEGPNRTQAQLRDILRHERRVELAFEGLRFFDLKRWGQVEAAYARMRADNITSYNPNYRGLRSETFPIPLSELDANKNLVQHPAWR
jgi:starch-binding outer membrane protein, SusD/RagB family